MPVKLLLASLRSSLTGRTEGGCSGQSRCGYSASNGLWKSDTLPSLLVATTRIANERHQKITSCDYPLVLHKDHRSLHLLFAGHANQREMVEHVLRLTAQRGINVSG